MNGEPTPALPSQPQAQELLAAYQKARNGGRLHDLKTWLESHPDLSQELRSLLGVAQGSDTQHLPGASPQPIQQSTLAGAPSVAPPSPSAVTLGAGEPAPTGLPIGHLFGDYEILEEVARGGMGVVFKARQRSLNRIVALKMILTGQLASAEQVRRFHIEAEEAGRLDHPNIVPIYQVGEERGQHYFSMKLIEGHSLDDHLAELRKDIPAAVRLVAEVARAVHYAHQHGILHRDIKPGNILIDEEGRSYVTDFGLAKHLGGEGSNTQSGAIMGTPSYMAPEQAAGAKELSTAADVYSLGAILYEGITGRPPFLAENAFDTLLMVIEDDPVRPRDLNPAINRDLETICLTCLNKDPARRYPSALALAEDLDRWQTGDPIRARPVGRVERLQRWARRRPAAAALVVVVALAAVALGLGGWWSSAQLKSALGVAQANAAEAQRQRELVRANFEKRLESVDKLLTNFDSRLENVSGMSTVRMEFLQEFLQLSHGLLEDSRDNPSARRQQALLHRRIGDLYFASLDSTKEALASYRQAAELLDALAGEFPREPIYRNERGQIYARQARVLQSMRQFAQARDAFRQAIDIQDRLAAEVPADPDPRDRAAYYLFELANLMEEVGLWREALPLYTDALARQEKLTTEYPKKAAHLADASRTAESLAVMLTKEKPDEARDHFERSLKFRRKVVELEPGNREHLNRLREGFSDLAAFHKNRGEHAELPRLAAELRLTRPDDNLDTYNAACYLADAVTVVKRDRKLDAGERDRLIEVYASQAVDLLRKSIKEGNRGRAHMGRDPDLDPLRDRKDYQEMLAELDKHAPDSPTTPARELEALAKEYGEAVETYRYYRRRARTVAEKKKAESKRPEMAVYVDRFLQFAERNRSSASSMEALVWVLSQTTPTDGVDVSPPLRRLRERALATLERDHFQKPEMAEVCLRLSEATTADCQKLLRAAIEKHSHRDVRGLSGFALAQSLIHQAEELDRKDPVKAASLTQQAEQELEKVLAQYETVSYGKTTLGEAAKATLYDLRHLSVGRPAPEIEGEDLDGGRLKLSEYKGKVVVLSFWANWCGFCRHTFPDVKALVRRMDGRPFIYLGVNSDDSRDEVKQAVKKQGLNWQSWWDGGVGGGRITSQWQVEGFPHLVVLDHKGVIRYRHLQSSQLNQVVEKLMREAEADVAKP